MSREGSRQLRLRALVVLGVYLEQVSDWLGKYKQRNREVEEQKVVWTSIRDDL